MDERSTLQDIQMIDEFVTLNEFLQDDNLDMFLDLIAKLIAKPGMDPGLAVKLIVSLQALSAKYAILASVYTTILRDRSGTENNHKKNIYYSLKEALDRVVDSLKYLARAGL